jgi:hypothetical protein
MKALTVMLCGVFLLAIIGAGCTDRRATADDGPLPVAPTAYPTGPASSGPGVANVSEDIQALTVRIDDGQFGSDVYDMQLRPVRIDVQASGGPYTLEIEGLVDAQSLDADGETVIGVSPANPGSYTMTLNGESTDTATLNVRAAGER